MRKRLEGSGVGGVGAVLRGHRLRGMRAVIQRSAVAMLGLAWSILGRPAQATEPSPAELAAAREVFQEARTAEEMGRWKDALEKLEAVAAVKMTAQIRFHLGLCKEKLGRLVEALNEFELAQAEASAQHAARVAAEAPEHAAQIRGRIAHLLVELPPGMREPDFAIDGSPYGKALLPHPIPMDPGRHEISARSQEGSYQEIVFLGEGEQRTVTIVLSPLGSSSSSPRDPASEVRTEPSGVLVLDWAVLGTGGLLLLGAGGAALVRADAISTIDEQCPTHQQCSPELRDEQDRAGSYGTAGAVLAIGGGIAVASGVLLIWRHSSAPTRTSSKLDVAPLPFANTVGASAVLGW